MMTAAANLGHLSDATLSVSQNVRYAMVQRVVINY